MVANLIIKKYQIEDLINILLNNDYRVTIQNNDKNTVLISVYQDFDIKESEGN